MSIGTTRTCSYIVLHCCLVYDYRSLIMCLRLRLRVTTYVSEFAPATVFFGSTSILMPVLCFDKHTYVMPHNVMVQNLVGWSTILWIINLPFPFSHWVTLFPREWDSVPLYFDVALLTFRCCSMLHSALHITGGRSSTSVNGDIAIQWEWSNFDHS